MKLKILLLILFFLASFFEIFLKPQVAFAALVCENATNCVNIDGGTCFSACPPPQNSNAALCYCNLGGGGGPPPPPPNCNTGIVCGACLNPGTNTSCNNNNSHRNCTYTAYTGGGSCNRVSASPQACTYNSCTSPSWACINGGCIPYYTISGNITDSDGNGTPSIPVHVAGHSTSGGSYTFGYNDAIRAGSYTVTDTMPSNYIPTGTTSIGVSVPGNKSGVNFTVARVFSISGTITDVDGNGTPSIPVKCGAGSSSGGNFTIPYSAHLRKGTYTCSLSLPANYIPIGPTSQSVTVGGTSDKTGVNFTVARVFSISGTITDVDGNGTPSIPVTCGGGSSSGGNFTIPYSAHLRKGTYTCSLSLPANYIPIGPTSQSVTVGGTSDKTGVNFTVARVFSISGTITDVDGNGTPSIPVTCGGGSSSGGSYTIPYSAHLRRGSYTCSISLPANYIPIGPTSIGVTVGPDKTGVNFTVARVFSISGTITDVDGNPGNPGITVTCAGSSASGGSYTIPYSAHIRKGSYTCTISLPANYIAIGPTSVGVTVGPDRTGINFTVARVFSISGTITDPYNGNAGVGGITVSAGGGSATTNGSGNYTIPYSAHIRRGTYTATMTWPVANYTNVGPTTQSVTVGPDATGINFQVTKLFTITGNVFLDVNLDKLKDVSTQTGQMDVNYPSAPTIGGQETMPPNSANKLVVTSKPDGTYTITNAVTGNVTVSYQSLPVNYYMTTPLNGPPPSYLVTAGYTCNVSNATTDAQCNNGNITNLNFGIIDLYPWIQSECGDIRDNSGINNDEYYGDHAIVTSGSCAVPGIVFTGDTDANFGKGDASTTQQVIGGFNYPEVSNTGGGSDLSYTQLSAKAQTAGLPETNLSSVCNLGNCSLPGNLAHGIYVATGNVTLNGYAFPANADYVFLINGNLTLTGDITIPNTSTVVFATAGNITVNANVGNAANATTPNLDGIYSAGGSFIVQKTAGYCTDLRLNIGGTVLVNAGQTGGIFQNNRNLCLNNAYYPTIQFQQRFDFLLHMPEFVRTVRTVSQELNP